MVASISENKPASLYLFSALRICEHSVPQHRNLSIEHSSSADRANATATVVLPIPPLPFAIDTINCSSPFPCLSSYLYKPYVPHLAHRYAMITFIFLFFLSITKRVGSLFSPPFLERNSSKFSVFLQSC